MSTRRHEPSTATSVAGCFGLGLITSKVLYAWTADPLLSLVSGIALASLIAGVIICDAWRHPVE